MRQLLEFIRLSKPKAGILENVKGILAAGEDDFSAGQLVLASLREAEYHAEFEIVELGFFHSVVRQRLFWEDTKDNNNATTSSKLSLLLC